MAHLQPGQLRSNRKPAHYLPSSYAEHCTNCDRPYHECRCALMYHITRVDETGERVYIAQHRVLAIGEPMPTTTRLLSAEWYPETEALILIGQLNADIHEPAHQWGIERF